MDTKKKILDVALTLFSEKGYGNVYVGHIAEGVGIKAPSLYKHYKSKQDIFEAILKEMRNRYDKEVSYLSITGSDSKLDANIFAEMSEDQLVKLGMGLFHFFLHDEYECKFRKMLTIEQFSNQELAQIFSNQYINEPLKYQTGLFRLILIQEQMKKEDEQIMALQFYSPIYLLLTLCDREPQREEEALQLLEKHIRQFSRMYRECGK